MVVATQGCRHGGVGLESRRLAGAAGMPSARRRDTRGEGRGHTIRRPGRWSSRRAKPPCRIPNSFALTLPGPFKHALAFCDWAGGHLQAGV